MENKTNIKSIERDDDTKVLDVSIPRKRHPCPFYGFVLRYNLLLKDYDSKHILENGIILLRNCKSEYSMKEVEGDYCALAQMINFDMPRGLCQRESIKNEPNWVTCDFNTKKNKSRILPYLGTKVILKEGKKMLLRDWIKNYKKYC